MPTASVFLEPKEAGWVVRVGAVALASGKWVSAEAAVVQADHVDALARKALTSLTGKAKKSSGSPKRAWPLPIGSLPALLADLDAALAEHAEAATAWWHAHDVVLVEGEFPWLVAVSDVYVTPSTGQDVGTVSRLHGLGALSYVLGTLTGRFPASVIVACPDAEVRHRPAWLGTKDLKDYWPRSLCGVPAKAKAPLGRHSWTVGGDAAVAYVAAHGLTLPVRSLTAPMVVPAWVHPDAVTDVVYAPPVKDVETPAPAPAAVNVAVVVDKAATIRYVAALRPVVIAALAGTTPTPLDVIRACAVATVNVPTPTGAVDFTGGDLANLLITRGGIATALNVPGVSDAITALTGT